MTQVSTQAELAAAIQAADPNIQITANFEISALQTIGYAATISGAGGGGYNTLTKASGYNGPLFQVRGGGSLTLQNITLDGAQESHAQPGSSLVEVTGGTLTLDTRAMLRNNYARQGGGISANDSAGVPVTIRLQGNAVIRNNRALNNGGGIYVNYQLPDSSLEVSGQALVDGNTSGESGGGIYDRTDGTHSTLTITGGASITGNIAPTSGGGVYAVGCDFTLGGHADISYHNGTSEGGGVYWVGRRFLMERDSTITYNQGANAYGGLYLNPGEPFDIGIHGTFLENHAATAGGMCLDAAAGTIDLSNARFGENEAKTYGGGCAIRSAAPGYPPLTVTMEFVDFFSNQARLRWRTLSGPVR